MAAIIMEGVLFVALVVAAGTLLFFGLTTFTPLGKFLAQTRNRKAIERAAELTCPIHGALTEEAMVRLPSGERVCPECFKETVWQTR
ncbi:MAG: hypothetical protein IPK33_21530 [Gemmatimonadetes bacterium]|jgi:hypothetical protein|nr:hypothetical protein [Gemmatimonadota bacterium]MBK8060368.1 hypothetical protein [Gemmatimonadota bacterium]MBK8648297.1 hypothetical protein [Gemmatimonadota bacterium]HNV75933.1 hypothetical protein [Gemmatimonadaceae bacterium]